MSNLDRKSRRNFLASGLGAAAIGGVALAQQTGTGTGVIRAAPTGSPFNAGDNAILRFSLAAEILAAQMADAIAGDSAFAQVGGSATGQATFCSWPGVAPADACPTST